jgi:hypothetical protein
MGKKEALPMSRPSRVRCREIEAGDDAFARDFRVRTRQEFVRDALKRLTDHATPAGFPKYGYLLEADNIAVGVLLLIYSSVPIDGEPKIRCCVSSWYVEPEFRGYAPMLVSRALKHKHVTYFNISPAPHTLPILEAQGYKRYCSGMFTAVPVLAPLLRGVRIEVALPTLRPGLDLDAFEAELLLRHVRYGCLSVICSSGDRRYPFVFSLRRKYGIRYGYLVYCRSVEEFVRFAGPLGRFLASRGVYGVALDSDGPIAGLCGRYTENRPKYYKGPDRPRLGDLAYSERAMLWR